MELFSEMAKMGEEQFCGWSGQISKFHMGHFEFEVPQIGVGMSW